MKTICEALEEFFKKPEEKRLNQLIKENDKVIKRNKKRDELERRKRDLEHASFIHDCNKGYFL